MGAADDIYGAWGVSSAGTERGPARVAVGRGLGRAPGARRGWGRRDVTVRRLYAVRCHIAAAVRGLDAGLAG